MPFDQGTVSFRVCMLPKELPDDALDRFAAHAAGSLDYVRDEPQFGWVSGRHLLETQIDEETSVKAGYLHLALRQAVRKVPGALLRAECRMAELAFLRESGSSTVNRKERKRIKEEVTERLLPKMPPQISGIPVVIDAQDNLAYVGAPSQKQFDTFLEHFCQAIGFEPIPMTPEVACTNTASVEPEAIVPINFSPELADSAAGGTLGQNFLTWLWFYQEETGGELPPTQLGTFGLLLEGPLLFVADGPGALESVIRKGMPTLSAEAKAALTVGKKLKRAKIVLAEHDGEQWSGTVDDDEFVFRSLKLPEGEALDPIGSFEERINSLFVFQKVFYALFQRFINDFSNPANGKAFQDKAKRWVKERDSR